VCEKVRSSMQQAAAPRAPPAPGRAASGGRHSTLPTYSALAITPAPKAPLRAGGGGAAAAAAAAASRALLLLLLLLVLMLLLVDL